MKASKSSPNIFWNGAPEPGTSQTMNRPQNLPKNLFIMPASPPKSSAPWEFFLLGSHVENIRNACSRYIVRSCKLPPNFAASIARIHCTKTGAQWFEILLCEGAIRQVWWLGRYRAQLGRWGVVRRCWPLAGDLWLQFDDHPDQGLGLRPLQRILFRSLTLLLEKKTRLCLQYFVSAISRCKERRGDCRTASSPWRSIRL